ncbi:hypothetical protein B0H14DRAFT_3544174 [Mycena olivaceomarginata]|nr:hypothetical protein B0H14DRAFT_3544174 [Mycena olivaceomarginata]
MISEGFDKRSNLDLSISLSLSSPRIKLLPQSQELLSLLGMLPDGLSDVDLVQSKLPLRHPLKCKAVLMSTALAYSEGKKRLKVLMPIREYIQKHQCPEDQLVHTLLKHFQDLLHFFVQWGLQEKHSDLLDNIRGVCHLNQFNRFNRATGQGSTLLIGNFYISTSHYYSETKCDLVEAANICKRAISLEISTGYIQGQAQALYRLAWVEYLHSEHSKVQLYAHQSQRLARASGDFYCEAAAARIEVIFWWLLDHYKKSISLCIKVRVLLNLCGMSASQANHGIMNTQAEVHKCKSEYSEARDIYIKVPQTTSVDQNAY